LESGGFSLVIQALKERMDIHSDQMDLSEYNQMKILSFFWLFVMTGDQSVQYRWL